MAYYDRLRAEVPPSLVELLQIPGLGPKTVRQLNAELGIETIDDLRAAAEAGRLRDAPRDVGPDRGARPRGHRQARDALRPDAPRPRRGDRSTALIAALSPTPGVRSIEPAGSFRRRRGVDRRPRHPRRDRRAGRADRARSPAFGLVDSVLNRGGYKAAVRLMRGPQVDLMVMPPGEAGTYRIHFTGSKEHNVRLRAMARDRGWSLSEKGFLRIGEDGEPLTGDAAELRTFADRGRGVRLPRPALHRARAARGRRRDRGGAGRPAAGPDRRWPTCAATCTATPTGPTATTRSRSWPRPRAGAATPTRS